MIVKGIVEAGMGRGTADFVPTINLLFDKSPEGLGFGIYACRVKVDNDWFNAVMHFGPRSSLDNLITFEVNLFDFNRQIYGQDVSVEVLDKLRDIVKFDSIELLKKQIDKDILQAKEILKTKYEVNT